MSKKINITLSDKASQYFAEVQYGLPSSKTGDGIATNADVINETMCNSADFEKETDNQILNWLDDYRKLNKKAKAFAGNPTRDNYNKLMGIKTKKKGPAKSYFNINNYRVTD